nr:exopolysaccharide biosynthesis polyprenyl glycosylphosphotransferase [Sandaracinus amylolyticus]
MASPATMPPPAIDATSLYPVADILLGAVHADTRFCDRERDAVRRCLLDLLGTRVLPVELEQRLRDFDASRFDLESAVHAYSADPPIKRRALLAMARHVCEADGAYDLSEDAYLMALAIALSLDDQAMRGLLLGSPFDRPWAERLKRLEDIVLGAVFLAVSAPVMLACAIGVKLTSKGPALFKQRRYGLNGKEFFVYKFRSMTVAEDGAKVTQATKNDARVTKLGAFLRRSSLDELPQFLNVLKGDMSIVGPRPHAIAHNEHYKKLIDEYMLRHKVKPGITGWAQVNGWRGETDTLDKMLSRVEHDLYYIQHWSVLFDIEIVLRTVFGSAVRENAY